jgi:cytochrome c oxidase cbb3-type subunit I/II
VAQGREDPVLKFFVVGVTFYGMSTFEGPMLSIKSVNALSHYTDWTIAHVHAGALGWNGFMTFGMIYWLLPRLFQTKLYSKKLAELPLLDRHDRHPALHHRDLHGGHHAGPDVARVRRDRRAGYPDFVETVHGAHARCTGCAPSAARCTSRRRALRVQLFMTWRNRPATYAVRHVTAPRRC